MFSCASPTDAWHDASDVFSSATWHNARPRLFLLVLQCQQAGSTAMHREGRCSAVGGYMKFVVSLHWLFGLGATPLAMRGRGLWVARVAADCLVLLWPLTCRPVRLAAV